MANSDQQLIILVKHVLSIHVYATVMSTNRAVNTIMQVPARIEYSLSIPLVIVNHVKISYFDTGLRNVSVFFITVVVGFILNSPNCKLLSDVGFTLLVRSLKVRQNLRLRDKSDLYGYNVSIASKHLPQLMLFLGRHLSNCG
jgi:hypothetical protein